MLKSTTKWGYQTAAPLCYRDSCLRLSEFINVNSQLGLKIGSFILMNNVALSQFVQHRTYLR